MKLLIIHLGDIHLSADSDYSYNRKKRISDAINAIGSFDDCIMVFSGDVTQSGGANEVKAAFSFISLICSELKKLRPSIHDIQVLIVPGNHDIQLDDVTDKGQSAIVADFRTGTIESQFPSEALKMQKFRSLLDKNGCFVSNPLIDIRQIECGEKKIEFLLLNSAYFSTRENDKGLHYFPEWVIREIEKPTSADYCIGILHHAPEWFHDSMKNRFERALLMRCSALLYGHEHEVGSKSTAIATSGNTLFLRGNVFGTPSNRSEGGFTFDILDVDTSQLTQHSFVWNSSGNYYMNTHTDMNHLACREEKRVKRITPSYMQQLLYDDKLNRADTFECYVFPRIEKIQEQVPANEREFDQDILTLDAFLTAIQRDRRVIIVGSSDTGKTTLLKKLFLEFQRTCQPIIVDAEEFGGKQKNLIIRNAFFRIYGDDFLSYQLYEQASSANKVLIIDNIDHVKNFETTLFSDFEEEFGTIIVSVKDSIILNVFERARNAAVQDKQYKKYRLRSFYSDKRKNLVSELVNHADKTVENKESVVADIETCLANQSKYIPLTPLFINLFVDYYCRNIREMQYNSGNVFGKVFEANMTLSLREKLPGKITVEKAYLLLGMIAYKIHFTKTYPISIASLHEAITQYNADYDDEVDARQLIEATISAKILMPDSSTANMYKFSTQSQLSYFVARELNRRYHDDSYESDDIRIVLENACFGINGDILLFITYLTDNIKILRYIIEAAKEQTHNWAEFSLAPCNIGYLESIGRAYVAPPNANEKKEIEQKRIDQERQRDDKNEIQIVNVYDYDEGAISDPGNQLIRALSLLSVISKCLPNFEHLMKKSDKAEFVKMIYELPNRIFYQFACEVDRQIPVLVEFLQEETGNEFGNDENALNNIVTLLQRDSIGLLLEIYNIATLFSTKINTVRLLEKHDYMSQLTYRIQHLLIRMRQNRFSDFTLESDSIAKDSKAPIVEILVKNVARHYYFCGNLDYKQQQSLLDSHFGKQEQAKAKWIAQTNKKA